MKAINIMWDVDYSKDGKLLPTEVEIPTDLIDETMDEFEIEDKICDYLSDLTGFCHQGFDLSM